MTDDTDHEPDDGLYLSDAAIIRKLGFGLSYGYRLLRQLDKPGHGRKPYPQPDPLFGNRRFWPAVLQWHLDYHRVRAAAEPHHAPSDQPRWQENFHVPSSPSRETGRPENARPQMARA